MRFHGQADDGRHAGTRGNAIKPGHGAPLRRERKDQTRADVRSALPTGVSAGRRLQPPFPLPPRIPFYRGRRKVPVRSPAPSGIVDPRKCSRDVDSMV